MTLQKSLDFDYGDSDDEDMDRKETGGGGSLNNSGVGADLDANDTANAIPGSVTPSRCEQRRSPGICATQFIPRFTHSYSRKPCCLSWVTDALDPWLRLHSLCGASLGLVMPDPGSVARSKHWSQKCLPFSLISSLSLFEKRCYQCGDNVKITRDSTQNCLLQHRYLLSLLHRNVQNILNNPSLMSQIHQMSASIQGRKPDAQQPISEHERQLILQQQQEEFNQQILQPPPQPQQQQPPAPFGQVSTQTFC